MIAGKNLSKIFASTSLSAILLLSVSFSRPARCEDAPEPLCLNLVQTTRAILNQPNLKTRKALTSIDHLEQIPASARKHLLSAMSPQYSDQPEVLTGFTHQDACNTFRFHGQTYQIDPSASDENSIEGTTRFSGADGNTHVLKMKISRIGPQQLEFEFNGPIAFVVPELNPRNSNFLECNGYLRTNAKYSLSWSTGGTEPVIAFVSDKLLTIAGNTLSQINSEKDRCRATSGATFKKIDGGGSASGFDGSTTPYGETIHGETEAISGF